MTLEELVKAKEENQTVIGPRGQGKINAIGRKYTYIAYPDPDPTILSRLIETPNGEINQEVTITRYTIYSTTEKLPPPYTWVLVHKAGFIYANPWLIGFLRDDGRWFLNLNEAVIGHEQVTHWTELPLISPEQEKSRRRQKEFDAKRRRR